MMQIKQLPHSSWSRGGDQVWYTGVFTALSVVICAWTYYLLIIIVTQFSVVGFPLEVRTYPFNICFSTPTSLKKAKRRTVNIHGTCTWERERERERETETETERERERGVDREDTNNFFHDVIAREVTIDDISIRGH